MPSPHRFGRTLLFPVPRHFVHPPSLPRASPPTRPGSDSDVSPLQSTTSPPGPSQLAVLGVAFVSTDTQHNVAPRLGWSVHESLDTHQWKDGDWWRPAHAVATQVNAAELNAAEVAGETTRTTESDANGAVRGTDEDARKQQQEMVPPTEGSTGGGPPVNEEIASPQKAATSSWKIVAFSSHNYLAITTLWYDRLTDLGYSEHVIAAMDDLLFTALAAKGYRVEDHVVSPSEKMEPGA